MTKKQKYYGEYVHVQRPDGTWDYTPCRHIKNYESVKRTKETCVSTQIQQTKIQFALGWNWLALVWAHVSTKITSRQS